MHRSSVWMACFVGALATSTVAWSAPRSAPITATIEVGPRYEWIIESHFVGATVNAFVGRQYQRWVIGGRAQLFAGGMAGSATEGWSMATLDLSLGAMAEMLLTDRWRLQAGVGLEVTKFFVRDCYDAGDGCWWTGHGGGPFWPPIVNVGINVPVGALVDLWRSGKATLFLVPRFEYTGYLLPFNANDWPGSVQPSRSAITMQVLVGVRF